MDPVLMIGGWAAAVLSTAAAIRLGIKFGAKAIRAALADELRKLWRELDDQDRYFHDEIRELRADLASVAQELRPNGGASLRDQLGRVERMMIEHIRA